MPAVTALDHDLIPGLVARDEAATARFLELYWARAFRLACQLTGDAAAAEDVAQEAFVAALRGVHTLSPGDPLRAWLFRIVERTALKRVRSDTRREAREERALAPRGEEAPADVVARTEETALVREHLGRLSPKLRHALALRFLEGMSLEEVAATLEVPRKTVSSRVRLGLEALRAGLAPALSVSLAALPPRIVTAMEVPAPAAPGARALLAMLELPGAPSAAALLARAHPRSATLLAAAVALPLAALGLAGLLLGAGPDPEGATVAGSSGEPPTPARPPAAVAPTSSAGGGVSPPAARSPEVASLVDAPGEPAAALPAVGDAEGLSGTTIDEQARPVAGARVVLWELVPDPSRRPGSGVDQEWFARAAADLAAPLERAVRQRAWVHGARLEERGAAVSDAEGRFAIPWPDAVGPEAELVAQACTERETSTVMRVRGPQPGLGAVMLTPLPSFRVRARFAGTPVAGALVALGGGLSTPIFGATDAQGELDLRGLPEGGLRSDPRQVLVRAPGFASALRTLTAEELRAGQVELELTRATDVTGSVVDRAGRPVAGATVAALPDDPQWLAPDAAHAALDHAFAVDGFAALLTQTRLLDLTRSDAQGRFRLSGLALGRPVVLVVRAAEAGLGIHARRLEPQGAELAVRLEVSSQPLVVRLELDGAHVPADPRPGTFDDVPVDLERRDPASGRFERCAWAAQVRAGEVWFEGLPPGTYRVIVAQGAARTRDLADASAALTGAPFELGAAGEPHRMTVALDAGRTVRGRVVTRGGQGVLAFLSYEVGSRMYGESARAADGAFELALFPTQQVELKVRLDDERELTVVVPPGTLSLPDIVVEEGR